LQLPARGEIWHANFHPTQGREQNWDRPCLVVSITSFNHGTSDLVVVLPLTTALRDTPFHVLVEPPDGGISEPSHIMCEQVRALDVGRLLEGPVVRRYGVASDTVMRDVEDKLRVLLGLVVRRRSS
jgi:mRNA interferase MazF